MEMDRIIDLNSRLWLYIKFNFPLEYCPLFDTYNFYSTDYALTDRRTLAIHYQR